MTEMPALKTASVVLKYRAKSGYSAECTFKSHADCSKPMDANQTLIAAASEIARVVAIAGAGESVRAKVAEAIEAVYEDMPNLRSAAEVNDLATKAAATRKARAAAGAGAGAGAGA